MRFHYLKTWPVFFEDVRTGRKPFEIRLDDRKFDVDDVLILQEWDPDVAAKDEDNPSAGYTGRDLRKRVTYVLLPGKECPALKDGYCVMGLGPDVSARESG
jgi:hypothetical protein